MIELYENNISSRRYILAAIFNTFKESKLRLKNFRFRVLILVGILLLLYSTKTAIIYSLILFCLFLIHFINEMWRYSKRHKELVAKYPEGTRVIFNDEYFQISTVFGPKWKKIKWEHINLAYDNKYIGNISIYNSIDKEYYLFFETKSNESEFNKFKEKVNKLVQTTI